MGLPLYRSSRNKFGIFRQAKWPLYDTETLRAGLMVSELNFFRCVMGNHDASGRITAKNRGSTNILQPCQVPNLGEFTVDEIRLAFVPELTPKDRDIVFRGACFEFYISQISAMRCPLALADRRYVYDEISVQERKGFTFSAPMKEEDPTSLAFVWPDKNPIIEYNDIIEANLRWDSGIIMDRDIEVVVGLFGTGLMPV